MKSQPTKKRIQEFEQLINDIAEDMPLRRWRRRDFIGCIQWQQDELCASAARFSNLRVDILAVLAKTAVKS